ncbi:MAG TPA: hydroxymethylbilane synthase, partial [Alphaproteobacteria bacterium]|nr:hydroxymethylbilane synthase [Alphaproteobacteria bacterium]
MTVFKLPLRIGTRRSPLARVQAKMVRDQLCAAHSPLAAEGALEVVFIQ